MLTLLNDGKVAGVGGVGERWEASLTVELSVHSFAILKLLESLYK